MDRKVAEQRDRDAHGNAPWNPGLTPERLEHFARVLVDTIMAMLEKEQMEKLGQYRDH